MKRFFTVYTKPTLLLFLIIVAVVYSVVAVMTHRQFLTFGWDLGFFDQLIWKVSHFLYPFSSLTKVNLLANHFSPILFFFGPLYWIASRVEMLLIAQAILMVGASIPLFSIAKRETGHLAFSYAIVIAYLFFIGTQWSILNEFHEATIAPLFIALAYYGMHKKKISFWFWIGLFGLLITKEEFALLTAALGLTVASFYKLKKIGIIILFFSLGWFFFLTHVLMPTISEKGSYQHAHLSSVAQTPGELVLKIISDPVFVVQSVINPPVKPLMVIQSVVAFAILPVFAPLGIAWPLIEQFTMRLLYTGPQFTVWQNVNHHAAPAAILLAIASIYGAKYIVTRYKKINYAFLCVVIIIATMTQDIYFHGPIHSIFKPSLYQMSPWMLDAYAVINKIPDQAEIASQNSLIPHLSQREIFHLLPEIGDAEYVVVDLHEGPNKFAPLTQVEMKLLVNKLISSQQYVKVFEQGDAILLKRRSL